VTTAVAISDEGRVAATLPMSDVSWEAVQEWADERGFRLDGCEYILQGFGNVGSRVVALAHAGSERWRVDMDVPFPSAAVSESTVYIADRDEIQAVTLSDGEELWPAGLQADTVRS